jgi:fumarate reductase subunit C
MIAGSFGVSAALEQSGGAAAIANLIVSIGNNAGGGNFTIAAVYVATTLISQIIANNSAAALMFPIAATISKNDGVDVSAGWGVLRSRWQSKPPPRHPRHTLLSKSLHTDCSPLRTVMQIYLLSYAIMLGASSVFMSSFGYQVHLRATACAACDSCLQDPGPNTKCFHMCCWLIPCTRLTCDPCCCTCGAAVLAVQTNLMALAAGGHSSRDFLKFGSPMQIVLAVVSIVSLILHDSWGLVWLVTGLASLVVMGAPQVRNMVVSCAWQCWSIWCI